MPNLSTRFCLSQNPKRNQCYHAFLDLCRNQQGSLHKLLRLGTALMRKEKLYHHFSADHSLRSVALHLALFSLNLSDDPVHLKREITEEEALKIIPLFEKRIAARIPLAYLTQEAAYLGRPFYVNEQVLVPRSLMNTRFAEFLKRVPWENNRVLDLCAGSGCIGITLALLHPHIQVDLADLSAEALEVAFLNIKRYSLHARVRCIQSDLFNHLSGKYDFIISNPPYVTDEEYAQQPAEIKNEPALALKGGSEGLDLVNRILIEAKDYLNPQGILVIELGYGVTHLLKRRYPKVAFHYFCYKQPGKNKGLVKKIIRCFDLLFEWSGCLDGVVLCERKDLPSQLSDKSYPARSWVQGIYRFWIKALTDIKFAVFHLITPEEKN